LEQNATSAAAGKGETLTEELIKDSAAVSYAAGADTSVSTLTTFILAMTLHPEAQKRAQAELDAVLGDRLPTFADKDDLPYVTAIMKEVFRWIPVLPLAVPHRAINSGRYKDFHIPAGASVLGNAWYVIDGKLKWFYLIFTPVPRAILHDETIYVEPENFKPERFIGNNLPDPADSGAFGFGRRYVGSSP
jgi:cytochrome P450